MCLFFSGLILETTANPLFYGQSYGFVVSDPAGFVAAMDEYRESEAGQSSPALNTSNGSQCGYKLRLA